MDHRQTAMMHCSARIRERLNRPAVKRDVDKMRLALENDNTDCFMRNEYHNAIIGIVKYQNIYTRAVLDKTLGVVVTVGV